MSKFSSSILFHLNLKLNPNLKANTTLVVLWNEQSNREIPWSSVQTGFFESVTWELLVRRKLLGQGLVILGGSCRELCLPLLPRIFFQPVKILLHSLTHYILWEGLASHIFGYRLHGFWSPNERKWLLLLWLFPVSFSKK